MKENTQPNSADKLKQMKDYIADLVAKKVREAQDAEQKNKKEGEKSE
jgi:hypothetical protein